VRLGFVALPVAYFAFLAIATVTYLVLVEVVKRRLFSGLGSWGNVGWGANTVSWADRDSPAFKRRIFWHLSDMLVTQPTKQTADNTQSVICPMFRQHYSRNSLAIGNCENAHAIVRHVKGGLGAQNFNRNWCRGAIQMPAPQLCGMGRAASMRVYKSNNNWRWLRAPEVSWCRRDRRLCWQRWVLLQQSLAAHIRVLGRFAWFHSKHLRINPRSGE